MDIDMNSIRDNMNKYREANRGIERMVKSLVKECCSDLDDMINRINNAISDYQNPITDTELDFFILNLPVCVYYAYEQQELLGLSEDLAKQEKNTIYNNAYNLV